MQLMVSSKKKILMDLRIEIQKLKVQNELLVKNLLELWIDESEKKNPRGRPKIKP